MVGLEYFDGSTGEDNHWLKNLCLKLVKCEKESDVIHVLKNADLWNGKSTWRDYGNVENNFSMIGNQQASADRALVEKLTNSIDAMLLLECHKRGIDPESEDAPNSIKDALIRFFGFKTGSILDLRKTQRDELADSIQVVTTGRRSKATVTVIDQGEGQSPNTMPNTFLSLMKSNKLKIKFVQGSYNQGSTGALKFCGKENLQLILSKRMPEIVDKSDETSDYWGFTIIRKFPPIGNMKNVSYRYLVIDDKIPMFKSDKLMIRPVPGTHQTYGRAMEWGSFVKLYDYDLPSGIKASSYKLLRQRLDVLIPEIALPVSVWERRNYEGDVVKYPGHVYGLNVKLEEIKNKLENGFPSNIYLNVEKTKVMGTIYAFKDRDEKQYYSEEAIIYSLNGQSHGFSPRTFLQRKRVGLSHIANVVLVIVDCDALSRDQQTRLFMTSRDRLVNNQIKFELEANLESELKNHKGLKELNFQKRSERTQNMVKDDEILKDTIQDIVKQSMYLDILTKGKLIHSPVHIGGGDFIEKYVGAQFPSYFRLMKKFPQIKPKIARQGSSIKIKYETDVENYYFARPELPGSFDLLYNLDGKQEPVPSDLYKLDLWNGEATLTIEIPENYELGKEIRFWSKITDQQRINPFEEDFYIIIEEKIIQTSGRTGERNPKKPGNGSQNSTGHLDLPKFIPVYEKDWNDHDFDRLSSAYVIDNGDIGYDVYINMDNVFFRGELSKINNSEKPLYEHLYQTTLSLFAVGIINELDKQRKTVGEDGFDLEAQSRWITRSFSPLILPLMRKIIALSEDYSN